MLLSQRGILAVVVSAIVSSAVFNPSTVFAQGALEEIIVSAQRREQSIQEVPISLEAFSGAALVQQGLRSMEDVSAFSPSVEIDIRTQDQDIAVRGMGTTGNNLGLEQAVPTFLDGVHLGRTSMIMSAFLDVERLEVLRGPQPIAFGQNATAGAFSIISKKPTPEWAADVTAEYGNWGRMSLEGGIGGPISDTWGIRVAGQIDRLDGYLKDVVTGDMFPGSDEKAGRVTLQWNPSENFEATLKAEAAIRRREGDGMAVCRTAGEVPQTERAVTIKGQTEFTDFKDVLNYPMCDKFERIGIREGNTPFFKPVQGIDQEDDAGGIVDISTISKSLMERNDAHDNMDAYNYRLGLNYEFANGINMNSNTAYVDYARSSMFDNSSSPVPTNLQHRGEIFDMVSQEFRFLSPRGGAIEWEAGAFYQQEDLDLGNFGDPKYQTVTIRANMRQPYRAHASWQDTTWKSAFASLTWNFLGEKASLDVGARYTDIDKDSFIQGYAATWIFNIDPDSVVSTGSGFDVDGDPVVDAAGDGEIWATQHTDGDNLRNVSGIIVDCGDTSDPRRYQCGDYGTGYWTHQYNPGSSRRATPDAWDTRSPVDLGPVLHSIRTDGNGPFLREYRDHSLDPQVTLRYRYSDDLSLYAKWARAFKGGGADISSGSLPDSAEAFELEPENAENFEIGAKGTLLDGAANFNVTAFQITISDLQIATSIPEGLGTQTSFSTNAGKQRTRGIEFDGRWAATDHLTLGLNGALMDGKMVSFTGAGCTDLEFEQAETGPCITAEESEEILGPGADDPEALEGLIDRSGYPAPRTPDWKFVVDVDYWRPVGDNYKFIFNSSTTFVDGYIFLVEEFSEILKYDKRVIANLNVGFGDSNDTWRFMFWGRNLFEAGLKYFPEFDVNPEGRQDNALSPRNWFSYGVQFQYNYN